ncbi:BMP and activin membrane-bound inhibitor homolog a [Nelusetta ayraudi]|uniref:BMP and activin membrane-bound inhibitor homolog a n=1 Tax=Nelusetta ayraudi TaxID=303726 RepID=UPI003F721BA9
MDRQSTFISVWLQLELCAMAVLLTKGEIRCYCDAPHCVSTGYMCKSEVDACFTRVLEPLGANSPLTHGCLDPVANAAADVCTGHLECCHDDMCNYRGLQELAHTRDAADHSRYQLDGANRNLVTRVQELSSAREVWFRAAVIAVPIAGGLVLVLLVMLALRMLRSESKRLRDRRQQMLSRLHYSFHGHHHHHGLHHHHGPHHHHHHHDLGLHHPAKKLDLECMVPVTGHENCCLSCDKTRQGESAGERVLSLVHWGMYSGHGKLEFV